MALTIRKLSKVASTVMAVIGLVVVPHLRAAQDEDATKTVTKRAKKSAKDTTSNAATTDTNTTNKPVEKTKGPSQKGKVCAGKNRFRIRNLSRQGGRQSLGQYCEWRLSQRRRMVRSDQAGKIHDRAGGQAGRVSGRKIKVGHCDLTSSR